MTEVDKTIINTIKELLERRDGDNAAEYKIAEKFKHKYQYLTESIEFELGNARDQYEEIKTQGLFMGTAGTEGYLRAINRVKELVTEAEKYIDSDEWICAK